MACKKVRYYTRARASAALAIIKLKGKEGRDEQRFCECGNCRGWHLSSWALNGGKVRND